MKAFTMKNALILWLSVTISIPAFAQKSLPVADSAAPAAKLLDEVVIAGYNVATRKQYTGAVTTIPGAQVSRMPVASFDQALQGLAPGLYVAASSGQPGATGRVLIRGQANLGGVVSPLYVVDGIAVESGVFMSMNPSDFASVSILKDANATALYGARGANGVILITTKRGKMGPARLVFNTRHGVSVPTRDRFDMMNTAERLQFEEEVGLETGGRTLGPGWRFSAKNPANANLAPAVKERYAAILDSLRGIQTDWRDYLLRSSAPFHEYDLSASGGSENVRFYTSGNYMKQAGIAYRSDIERYSLRTNLDFTADRFSASVNTAIGYSNNDFIDNENLTNVGNPFAAVYYALPYEQPYVNGQLMHSGNKDRLGGAYDTREGSDALERMQNTTYRVNQLKGLVNTAMRYNILSSLFASANFGMDYRENVDTRTVKPGSHSAITTPGGQGLHREEMTRYYQFTATTGLTYTKSFHQLHNLTVSGFYEFNRMKTSGMRVTGYGITPGLYGTLSGITQGTALNGFIPQVGGGKTGLAMASWIALARYSYADKYLLNLTYRRDGSSTVPEQNRWKSFYSIGAGYDMSKETFLEPQTWLNTLRLRASYGTSASPFPGNFAYTAGYGASRYDGSPAIIPTSPGNTNYDWEYTKIFNAGVDVALFDQRLRLVADWYNRRTEGVFVEEQLSQTSGFSSRMNNAGVIRNRGIEIDLSGDIVRNGDFSWYAGINFTYNKNKIISLGKTKEFTQGTNLFRTGLPVNTHYVVKWAGVDPQTGKPQYYNRDGSITNVANPAQSVAEFGTSDPPYFGGFTTGAKWKGFSADVLFTYAQDYYRYDSEEFYTLNSNGNAASNQSRKWLSRWRKPGDVTNQPKFGEPFGFSSRELQNSSFVRLRNVQLAYTFPEKLLKSTRILRGAMVYMQGQNLLTFTSWTGFDPEDTNNTALFEYPAARTITAGARIQF
ncbi:SusC/RagA family TonB-linked outer membrane protein [Chitinophaga lutea]|uniref:SusC/RagA family TonB-linked outer membrane protein n=1 Tax=Chitinophaga lutea TaxID=2488634 RepID=A0A3N4Q3R0_9BACT|nr:SusC/RagA family TonB-linked outer membrane protein [Chitinophaga lutea]RPE13859.1 SusC/RagA family TonB-linked outer membrane protein [Chitinophaga lutea]